MTNAYQIQLDTVNDLETQLASKQDNLTAGVGISISDQNVISVSYAEPVWGNITGTLSNQPDLQGALDLKANASNVYTKAEIDTKLTATYKFKGSVQTYSDLPSTDLTVGDVYNIVTADPTHGIEAGDNVAWTGTEWDRLGGNVDLSAYYTSAQTDTLLAGKQPVGDYALRSELPVVPTNVSAFTNDAGYLTQHQDISGKQDVLTPGNAIDITNNVISYTGPNLTWGNILGTLSQQTDLQAALDAKGNDADLVHKAGAETISGVKTFSAAPVVSGVINTNTNKITVTGTDSLTLKSVECATPTQGDNSNLAATTAFVKTAIDAIDALPSQTGQSGKFLSTDGTDASWETVDLSSKQDALSSTQLDAVNSGINSTKVGNYDTHIADTTVHVTSADKTAWNAKQDALTAGTGIDITNNVITASYPVLVSYDSANRNLSFATSSNIQGDLNEVINGSGV